MIQYFHLPFIYYLERQVIGFFRTLKPNVQEDEYEYFDLNNPIIDTDVSQHKILKSKCRMTPLEPHEIDLINNSIRYHYCYYYPIENHIINQYRYFPLENRFINS